MAVIEEAASKNAFAIVSYSINSAVVFITIIDVIIARLQCSRLSEYFTSRVVD